MDLISIEQEQGSKFRVTVKGHSFSTDLSEEDGGNGEAPAPTQAFVGALGACMGLVIERYCTKHGLPAEGISLSMTFQYAQDPIRIGTITADIELPRDFPENRKGAILQVIKACPVHNTLHNPPILDLEIVSEDPPSG